MALSLPRPPSGNTRQPIDLHERELPPTAILLPGFQIVDAVCFDEDEALKRRGRFRVGGVFLEGVLAADWVVGCVPGEGVELGLGVEVDVGVEDGVGDAECVDRGVGGLLMCHCADPLALWVLRLLCLLFWNLLRGVGASRNSQPRLRCLGTPEVCFMRCSCVITPSAKCWRPHGLGNLVASNSFGIELQRNVVPGVNRIL